MEDLDLTKYDNSKLSETITKILKFIESRTKNGPTIKWEIYGKPGEYFYQIRYVINGKRYSLGRINSGKWISQSDINDALINPEKYFNEKKLINYVYREFTKYIIYSPDIKLYKFIIENNMDHDSDDESSEPDITIRWLTETDVINMLEKIKIKYKE